ncbi:T9SS type B sorting domain-containing protein, partial [Winogradskyella luteola]
NCQTVFARVEDTTTGCYDTTALELCVEQAPVANVPQPLRYCDPDNDGFGMFPLADADTEITGGAAGLTVTYHETFANADNDVDALDTTVDYNNITVDTQTLYARVESATIATDCATIVELVLIVEPSPQIVAPTPLEACDDALADGFATFDLTAKAPEVLNGLDPVQYTVSYYLSEADADAPMNPIATPNAFTNTDMGMQTVWIRVEDTDTVEGCHKVTSLELIVNPLPVLLQPSPLELCDVDSPGDEQEPFDLEDANAGILNGQTGITLTYYLTQMDADNATGPLASPYVNTSNPQTIYIRGENDITGCHSTVTLTLRVNPLPSPEQSPEAIEICDDDNDGFAEFDMTIRTVEITNGESDVVITYHETQEDAEMGDNALASPYTNIVAGSQMVYVRSESTLTGCYRLTLNTLELIVVPSPEVPTALDPIIMCDDGPDGITQFDLAQRDADILGSQNPADVILTHHVSAADAESGDDPIINVGNYTNISNPQTIYVRLYNPTTECYDTGEFELQVELPPTAVQPAPLELCDDLGESPGDEMTVFDLTVKDQEITGGNASWSVAYYQSDADAQAQTGAVPDPTQYTNISVGGLPANPQTLYVVVTDTDTGCVDFTTLTIRVLPNPTPTPSDQLPALELCDGTNTGDGFEIFDLTENEALLINGEAGVTATYHETPEDAGSGMNPIADPAQYTNISAPEQEIYVRVTNDITGCYALVDFTVRVNPLPDVVAVTDFIQCELNTDGFDSFDLTGKDAEVLNGQDPAQFMVTYHVNLADAEAGMNALVSPYTNTSNPQRIFVTITNNVTGCSISTQSFNIQVDEAAEANPDMEPILYEACDDNMETDGNPDNDSVQFDLSTQDAQVLDGQDANSYIVSYYASEADADLNVNPLPNLYENVTNPQVVYARVDNNTLSVVPVFLNIADPGTPGLDLDGDGTVDLYDTDGDGVFDLLDVDGDGLSDGIDNDGDGAFEFVDTDGDGLGDPVDLNNDGTFDNQQDGSVCFAVAPLTLQVNPLPNFDLEDGYILCVNTNGTEILDPLVLDTGLSGTDHSFEWSYNGAVIPGESGPTLAPTQGGTYSVTVTDIGTSTQTSCTNMDSTLVTESEPPTLIAEVTTQAFADNHVIEAVASGPGVYEYSLDGGPWQDSGTFTGVSAGGHLVTARDKNGCGTATVEVFVLDYPLYFTPNGDGNHDTWNIAGIGAGAKIYIFDRYGKLLKQLGPTGTGWDGTYNGSPMPTSDYWFLVEYDEPTNGNRKEFKA